jgi:hypothetical protein
MLIRVVTWTVANGHDRPEFENVVTGDEEMTMADKAGGNRAKPAPPTERNRRN